MLFIGADTADASGTFSISMPMMPPVLPFITATTTDIAGNTSAFNLPISSTGVSNETQPAGSYEIRWNADDLASGVYLCSLQAGNFIETGKLHLLR